MKLTQSREADVLKRPILSILFTHSPGLTVPRHGTLSVDNYAKDGGSGEVWLLCNVNHEPLHTWIKTNVNKFAILSHTALKLGMQNLRSYMRLTCEYELDILTNTEVSLTKDHVENYMKIRPLLARHRLRNCLFYYLNWSFMWQYRRAFPWGMCVCVCVCVGGGGGGGGERGENLYVRFDRD